MRSCVLNPYQMVKDLRTSYEVSSPGSVFDGDIDGFIDAAGASSRKRPRTDRFASSETSSESGIPRRGP